MAEVALASAGIQAGGSILGSFLGRSKSPSQRTPEFIYEPKFLKELEELIMQLMLGRQSLLTKFGGSLATPGQRAMVRRNELGLPLLGTPTQAEPQSIASRFIAPQQPTQPSSQQPRIPSALLSSISPLFQAR